MSIDPGIDDIIEGGAAAFKFENIGDTCKGRVVRAVTQQQTDIVTNEPKTFPSGQPMMQVVITVEQDDGEEATLYFKGGNYEVVEGKGQSALSALRDALGDRRLEVGGTLAMQLSGFGKKKNPAYSAPKLYVCQYEAPTFALPAEESLI